MPTNHGEIRPHERQRKKEFVRPHFLRGKTLRYNIDLDEAASVFLVWKMRALRDVMVYGRLIPAGDEFSIAGNDAVLLAEGGDAEIIDKRVKEETEAIEKMRALGLDKPARAKDNDHIQAQLQQAAARKPSWVKAGLPE